MRTTIGDMYRSLGLFREQEAQLRKALELRRQAFGPDDRRVESSLHDLAHALADAGDPAGAAAMFRQALDLSRKLSPGGDDPEVARCMHCLGVLLGSAGQPAEGETLVREALAMNLRIGTPESRRAAIRDKADLGEMLLEKLDLPAAEPLLRETIEFDKNDSGADTTVVRGDKTNLAILLSAKGDLGEAERSCGRCWRLTARASATATTASPPTSISSPSTSCVTGASPTPSRCCARRWRSTARRWARHTPPSSTAARCWRRSFWGRAGPTTGRVTRCWTTCWRPSASPASAISRRPTRSRRSRACGGRGAEWLGRARAATGEDEGVGEAEADLFLAMAHQKLGRSAEAEAVLGRATRAMDGTFPRPGVADLGGWPQDWLICQIVRREAEATVGATPAAGAAAAH